MTRAWNDRAYRRTVVTLLAGTLILVVIAVMVLRGRERESRPAEAHAGHSGMDMPGMVHVDPELARSIGVVVVPAVLDSLRREIRATGQVLADETRLSTITTRVGGFVERLHVDFTGQPVRRGQPVLEIYSQELLAAQEELLAAVRLERELGASQAPGVARRGRELAEAARQRLLLWGISREQIDRVERTGQASRTLTLHAPAGGVVLERLVQAGQAVEPGMPLYRIADLSVVWVEADIFEQDLRFVRPGDSARIEIAAYPGETFSGRIAYVYPDVRLDTRTARVRIALANSTGRIRPGMFATVVIASRAVTQAVLVPRDAVLRTGARDIVFVETTPGMYDIREVRVGMESGDATQILSGLSAGELVVARAGFMLDADSRLMEAMQPGMPGMEGMDMGGTAPPNDHR